MSSDSAVEADIGEARRAKTGYFAISCGRRAKSTRVLLGFVMDGAADKSRCVGTSSRKIRMIWLLRSAVPCSGTLR
jgi:hypothetical protein